LQPDVHHIGRVLFARTIDTPIRLAAVQTIIEDETGDAERLAVYNSDPNIKAEALLPENALFAIKEPFYWFTGKGSCNLRVDHPSDLVPLNPLDSRIPRGISGDTGGQSRSALDWKAKGNTEYGSQSFLAARQSYTYGLDACKPENSDIRLDMLRNRSVVNIFLKRFSEALTDAEAAIIPPSEREDSRSTALNVKAYERAGHAAYELGNLEKAQVCYRKILGMAPDNADATRNLKRIQERIHERMTGDYDFDRMSRSASKRNNRLDHASYISFARVSETERRGRGLFATQDLKAGQLILAEKAKCVAFESDKINKSYAILNQDTQRGLVGSQAVLLFMLVERLLYNQDLAVELLELFAGGHFPDTPLEAVDGLLPIDTFRVQGIVEHNSFECPTVRSSSHQPSKDSADTPKYRSTGLWLKAAYINHACDGNAMRSFIGDIIIIRAVRDIAKDEEILMPYQLPDAVNAVTQERLEKTWGFKCDCRLCTAESSSSFKQRRDRSQLIEKARSLLSDHSLSKQHLNRKVSIGQAENLLTKLQATYDEATFENRPRLGLVSPGFWLCQAYSSTRSHERVIKSSIALLRDLGFIVSIEKQSVSIDRRNCQPEGTAMDAAMYAAHAFKSQKKTIVGDQLEDFAKSLYLTMYGEMRGFEERYSEQLRQEAPIKK
jgi:tetratricopeptide (TPR) repeat protein